MPTAARKPGKYACRCAVSLSAVWVRVPHRVLLGAGEDRDGLGEFGVGWQCAVGGGVRAQDVRRHHGVEVVGFLAGERVAVAVAGGGHGG
jgi:hypothetical protein